MSEDPELQAHRGAQAGMELRETAEAFDQVRAGFLEGIATSALGETDFREYSFMAIFVLESVRARLIAVAAGEPMAAHDNLIRDIMDGKDKPAD